MYLVQVQILPTFPADTVLGSGPQIFRKYGYRKDGTGEDPCCEHTNVRPGAKNVCTPDVGHGHRVCM